MIIILLTLNEKIPETFKKYESFDALYYPTNFVQNNKYFCCKRYSKTLFKLATHYLLLSLSDV